MDRRCFHCGTELVPSVNWYQSLVGRECICARCWQDKKNERRRNGAEPNRSRRHKVVYCDHPECSSILRAIVLERGNFSCGICGDPIDGEWHMDHIIPVSKNGPHCYYNLQPSHPTCNIVKGDTILAQ